MKHLAQALISGTPGTLCPAARRWWPTGQADSGVSNLPDPNSKDTLKQRTSWVLSLRVRRRTSPAVLIKNYASASTSQVFGFSPILWMTISQLFWLRARRCIVRTQMVSLRFPLFFKRIALVVKKREIRINDNLPSVLATRTPMVRPHSESLSRFLLFNALRWKKFKIRMKSAICFCDRALCCPYHLGKIVEYNKHLQLRLCILSYSCHCLKKY